MIIQIKKIEQATSLKGKTYWKISDGAKNYTCWDSAIAASLTLNKAGDVEVREDIDDDKIYRTITGIKPKTEPVPDFLKPDVLSKDQMIARHVALKASIEFTKLGDIKTVLTAAEEFEKWLMR